MQLVDAGLEIAGRMVLDEPAARLGQIYEIGMSVFTHPDSGDAVAYVSE